MKLKTNLKINVNKVKNNLKIIKIYFYIISKHTFKFKFIYIFNFIKLFFILKL